MKINICSALLPTIAAGITACGSVTGQESTRLTDYVDPMIGTGGHGHVFLGANVPFGMVQLGPSQVVKGWDWCSGYHYSDTILLGFSHTHLSGTGIGDLGDILFFPTADPSLNISSFSHDDEVARPGYYSVKLKDAGVDVKLTATPRTGIHQYEFNPSDSAYLKINLKYGIGWDRSYDTGFTDLDSTSIAGHRFSTGWAHDQKIYFQAEFSRPIVRSEINDTLATLVFAPSEQPLVARVGISPNSVEKARINLETEAPDFDFNLYADRADEIWNENLSRMTVEGGSEKDKKVFYTSLFHTMTAPAVFTDADDPDPRYTIFSLWDTYRAAHPLYTLILPGMQRDFANTFLDIYDKQGKLPVWHLHGNETNCMVGNPGVIVLGDLALKGFVDSVPRALEAMRQSALLDERSLYRLKSPGYIAYDLPDGNESVAKALEYAVADNAIARVAAMTGEPDTMFERRGRAYALYFDPSTGFLRGRDSNGNFRPGEFDPFSTTHRADDYCEGNAWQYLWMVPQDPHGLIEMLGGEEKFLARLDSLFIVEGDLGEDASPDISGMIGQYAHGNEPSHHVAYLYNYAGQPAKGAEIVRRVVDELYDDAPDGLCGNEDVGQMSAWYVLSSAGLYQVEPAGGRFVIGSPVFDSVTISLPGNKQFVVKAVNNSPENIYIQSATLNSKPYSKGYIDYEDIMKGGTLELTMGPKPSDFATSPENRP